MPARIHYHEHPDQTGACLPGAMRDYVARIPLVSSGAGPSVDLDQVWQYIRHRPFEVDDGRWMGGCEASPVPLAELDDDLPTSRPVSRRLALCSVDRRCDPPQRSRIWPRRFNCWEASAHFARAAGAWLPGDGEWEVHIWDRDLERLDGEIVRHVWPSLVHRPTGMHMLVDLESVTGRRIRPGQLAVEGFLPYTGVAADPANTEWWNHVLGGLHFVGDKVLRIFGAGAVSDMVEPLWGDLIPEWSRTNKTKPEEQPKEAKRTPPEDSKAAPAKPTDSKPEKDSKPQASPARPRSADLMDDRAV